MIKIDQRRVLSSVHLQLCIIVSLPESQMLYVQKAVGAILVCFEISQYNKHLLPLVISYDELPLNVYTINTPSILTP